MQIWKTATEMCRSLSNIMLCWESIRKLFIFGNKPNAHQNIRFRRAGISYKRFTWTPYTHSYLWRCEYIQNDAMNKKKSLTFGTALKSMLLEFLRLANHMTKQKSKLLCRFCCGSLAGFNGFSYHDIGPCQTVGCWSMQTEPRLHFFSLW